MSVNIEKSLFTGSVTVDNDDEGNTVVCQSGGVVKLTKRQVVELCEVFKVIIDHSNDRRVFEQGGDVG